MPADDLDRPGARHVLRASRRHDRAVARHRREGHLPGGRSARLDLAHARSARHRRGALSDGAPRAGRSSSATRRCRTSSPFSAWTSFPKRTSSPSRAPARSSASCRSPSTSPTCSPARPAVQVKLEDTIKGFKGLCEGQYDHLPEPAFYMVGTIEEAVEKAKRLARGGLIDAWRSISNWSVPERLLFRAMSRRSIFRAPKAIWASCPVMRRCSRPCGRASSR